MQYFCDKNLPPDKVVFIHYDHLYKLVSKAPYSSTSTRRKSMTSRVQGKFKCARYFSKLYCRIFFYNFRSDIVDFSKRYCRFQVGPT